MPIQDDAFILTERPNHKHDNKLWGLSSERLAKRMKHMMTLAGIPADFLAHSARHAGVNMRKDGATLMKLGYQTKPWCDQDVMQHARMSAKTYVTHYLRSIRASTLEEHVPSTSRPPDGHLRF